MAHVELTVTPSDMTPADLDETFMHNVDSQDIQPIIEDFGLEGYDFGSFFVKIENGDFVEVYGCMLQFPYDWSSLFKIELTYS